MIRATNVSPGLADDESTDVVRIAGADSCQHRTAIQETEPVVKRLENVGLLCTGVDDFYRACPQQPVVGVLAGHGVVALGAKWAKSAVNVAGMVEDDRPGGGPLGNAFENRWAVFEIEIGDLGAGDDGKNIEMTGRGR